MALPPFIVEAYRTSLKLFLLGWALRMNSESLGGASLPLIMGSPGRACVISLTASTLMSAILDSFSSVGRPCGPQLHTSAIAWLNQWKTMRVAGAPDRVAIFHTVL